MNLRRAVSTAYYAMFHCLARNCADQLIGGRNAARSNPAWRQVYRALDHGAARRACERPHVISKFPKGIEDFANIFSSLQEKRHIADYDPDEKFYKSSATLDIDAAEDAIRRFEAEGIKDRRAFAALVLFKRRNS